MAIVNYASLDTAHKAEMVHCACSTFITVHIVCKYFPTWCHFQCYLIEVFAHFITCIHVHVQALLMLEYVCNYLLIEPLVIKLLVAQMYSCLQCMLSTRASSYYINRHPNQVEILFSNIHSFHPIYRNS